MIFIYLWFIDKLASLPTKVGTSSFPMQLLNISKWRAIFLAYRLIYAKTNLVVIAHKLKLNEGQLMIAFFSMLIILKFSNQLQSHLSAFEVPAKTKLWFSTTSPLGWRLTACPNSSRLRRKRVTQPEILWEWFFSALSNFSDVIF